MSTPPWWPAARAALLTLVVAGNLLYAVPFPRKEVAEEDREKWRTGDLEMWHGWLTSAGVDMPYDTFRDQVIDGSNQLWAIGRSVQAPVRPAFTTLRTTQQWGLFGVVAESPEALVVEVERDGTWVVVEKRLDPDHDWRDAVFRYRRVRGTWDTIRKDQPAPLYEAFCRWTAREALRDFPDATAVRISRERSVVNAPWEEIEAEPKTLNERTYQRDLASLWVLR